MLFEITRSPLEHSHNNKVIKYSRNYMGKIRMSNTSLQEQVAKRQQ